MLLMFLTNVMLAWNCHLPAFIFNLWSTQKREVSLCYFLDYNFLSWIGVGKILAA